MRSAELALVAYSKLQLIIHLSLLAWIQKGLDPARAYGPYVKEKDSMASGVLGKVLESKSDKFASTSGFG